MTSSFKRKLTIGAVGTALLGIAAGGAYAATQSTSTDPAQAFLDNVAGRLHVSSADLKAALQGASADQLDAAVKAGKLTQAEADAIKKKMANGAGVPFLGVPRFERGGPFGGAKPFFGGRFFGGPFLGGMDAAAKYLGLTDVQLKTELGSGKSLADVAKAHNKSVPGLETAIKDAVKTDLDAQVAAKHITAQQETKILTALDGQIHDLVNGTPPEPPKFARPGAPGGKHFGFKFEPGG